MKTCLKTLIAFFCLYIFHFSAIAAPYCPQMGSSNNQVHCVRPTIMYKNNYPDNIFSSPVAAAEDVAYRFRQANPGTTCDRGVMYSPGPWIKYTHFDALYGMDDGAQVGVYVWRYNPYNASTGHVDICSVTMYVKKYAVCPMGYDTILDSNTDGSERRYMCKRDINKLNRATSGGSGGVIDLLESQDGNPEGCKKGCNPVSLASRTKIEQKTDYKNNRRFPLEWKRFYSNRTKKWSFSYHQSIDTQDSETLTTIFATREDGNIIRFSTSSVFSGSERSWIPEKSYILTQLKEDVENGLISGYRLLLPNGLVEHYDRQGGLLKVTDMHGDAHHVFRDSKGRVIRVEDQDGFNITIEYQVFTSINNAEWEDPNPDPTQPQTRTVTYNFYNSVRNFRREIMPVTIRSQGQKVAEYDWTYINIGNGEDYPLYTQWMLSSVSLGSSVDYMIGYLYGQVFPNGKGAYYKTDLTGIVDGRGEQYGFYTYTGNSNYQSSYIGTVQHGSTNDIVSYYDNSVVDNNNQTVTFNGATTATAGKQAGQNVPCASCGGLQAKSITYDSYGNPISITDFDNKLETRSYDGPRGLMLSRTFGSGTQESKTIVWTYHPTLPLPLTMTETMVISGQQMSLIHAWEYNSDNQLIKQTISVSPSSPITPDRVTRWSYNAHKDLDTMTDSNGRVTKYVYDVLHQLVSITEGFGTSLERTTTVSGYDIHGFPLGITNSDGSYTSFVYNSRHQIIQTTQSKGSLSLTESWNYDLSGLLSKRTETDGQYEEYEYDSGHRIVRVIRRSSNGVILWSKEFGYNTGNKVTSVVVKGPNSEIISSDAISYDALRRATSFTDALNNTNQRSLSPQGRILTRTDPLGHVSTYTYNALSQVSGITNAVNKTSSHRWSGTNLIESTDSKGTKTLYTYNAFGDLLTIHSPDRGVWTQTYDSGGDLSRVTDPRGVSQEYTYDDLGRLSQIIFDTTNAQQSGPSQTYIYTYDSCPNGMDRVCSISTPSGSLAYHYNTEGLLTGFAHTDQVYGVTLSLGYYYDTLGRVTHTVYPSGKVLVTSYGLDGRPMSLNYDQQPILNDTSWRFDGQPKGWSWEGSGFLSTGVSFQYDLAHQISSIESSLGPSSYVWEYVRNKDGLITQINRPLEVGRNQQLAYDPLHQISHSTILSPAPTSWSYLFDDGGNLTSFLNEQQTGRQWIVSPNSNHLLQSTPVIQSVGGGFGAYQYDLMGNITQTPSGDQLSYDAKGRVVEYHFSGALTTMAYNGLGQRTRKEVSNAQAGNGVFFEHYDPSGQLVGVYQWMNGELRAVEEMIYLDHHRVVALVRPDSQSGMSNPEVFRVVSDHIRSPRHIISPIQQVVWSWDGGEVFGDTPPVNPNLGNQFVYDGRFPGQRFDSSTESLNNGFRTYSIKEKRYLQSDPLGLEAGWNTYAYVEGNPVSYMDPFGLRKVIVEIREGGAGEGAGHVKIKEMDGTSILNSYPRGVDNNTKNFVLWDDQVQSSKELADVDDIFVVDIDDENFDIMVKQMSSRPIWTLFPSSDLETNCAHSAKHALRAGGVNVNAVDGRLFVDYSFGLADTPAGLSKSLKRHSENKNSGVVRIEPKK